MPTLAELAKGWKRPRRSIKPSLNALAIRLSRMRQRGEDVTHSETYRQYCALLNQTTGKDVA